MKKTVISILVFLAMLGIRSYFVYHDLSHADKNFSSHKVTFEGFVDEDPDVRDTKQRIVVKVSKGGDELLGKRVILSVPKFPRFGYGTELKVSGSLDIPKSFETDRGEFNYRAYLGAKDIWYTIQTPRVSKTGSKGGYAVVRMLAEFKGKFVGHLEQVLGEPHASLAAGLLVGEKHSLSDELLTDFRRVGLTHIIVLSGYNITIVITAIGLTLSWLPRGLRIGCSALSVILFSVLVGGGATVIRSLFMALTALLGEYIKRDYSPLRALLIAGYIMVFHNPLIAAHDPSFQLSFVATLGLILLGTPLGERFSFLPEKYGVRGLVASTLATQIAVLPLILYLSGSISIGGMIVNFLVLPFVPVTMLSVFLTGMAGFVSYGFMFVCGIVSHLFLAYELLMVEWWAKFSWMSAQVFISGRTALIWYGLYGVIFLCIEWRKYHIQKATRALSAKSPNVSV